MAIAPVNSAEPPAPNSKSTSEFTSSVRQVITRDRIQPRSHRVGRARWVCTNMPHWISARTSGRSPRRLTCPGQGCAVTAEHHRRNAC